MVYEIKLPVFEGPMDLLLHLLDKNEVDIYDIPIALITQQYLEYLSLAGELDLELTSEFLLMACTLLAIKAKMLLPKHKASDAEEDSEDPRMELVEKIIEYKLFKEMAVELKERELNQSKLFCREIDEASLLKKYPPSNPLGSVVLADLLAAYSKVLKKVERRNEVVSISREDITIQEKIDFVLYKLCENQAGISFTQLFSDLYNRAEIIMTFLALLELTRRSIVFLRQNSLFGDIFIFLKDSKGGQASAHSVS